jgi:hypothetical protein
MAIDQTQIRERMEVVAADGRHMGHVDRVEGERIKLTKSDASDGQHHFVKLVDADTIRDGKVWMSGNAALD